MLDIGAPRVHPVHGMRFEQLPAADADIWMLEIDAMLSDRGTSRTVRVAQAYIRLKLLLDYMAEDSLAPGEMRLYLAKPHHLREIDLEHFDDELPSEGEGEVPSSIAEALEALNAVGSHLESTAAAQHQLLHSSPTVTERHYRRGARRVEPVSLELFGRRVGAAE